MTRTPAGVTQTIIEFSKIDVPAAVMDSARLRLLDSVGVAVAGVYAPPSQAIIEVGQALSGVGQCNIFGSGSMLAPSGAALINGALIHTLDFDDTHLAGSIHPSAAVIGAALAAVDMVGGTIGDLTRGVAIGTEVSCWLSEVSPGELHDRGFLPTAVFGAIGGAVAASIILGLDDKRFSDAIGLASSVAAGSFQLEESWVKNWNGGWAANVGISAAIAARVGYNGPIYAVEGPKGLFATHTNVRAVDPSTLIPEGLWRSQSIALKRYSCCHFLHSTIDCALELSKTVDLEKMEKIIVSLPPLAIKSVTTPHALRAHPVNNYRARFAGHWVLARAMTDGDINLATFEDYASDRPDVVAIVEKMELVETDFPNFPRDWPSLIQVHNQDGSIVEAYRDGEAIAVGAKNEALVENKLASNLIFAGLGDHAAEKLIAVSKEFTRPAADLWHATTKS